MKLLVIYSQHDPKQLEIIERVKAENSTIIDEIVVLELEKAQELFHIRATPALIPICDHWQGDKLIGEGVDGKLLVTALVSKLMEDEELSIHQAETHRLDNLINAEKQAAQDALMDDLIERKVL